VLFLSDGHHFLYYVQGSPEARGVYVGQLDESDPRRLLDADAAAFFAALGGIGAHVAAQGSARDLDGTYAKWFADASVAVVLQRPDFYVFGTAATVGGSAALVKQLRRVLGSVPPAGCVEDRR